MDTCTIYGYVTDGSGNGIAGVLVYCFPASMPAVIQNTDYAVSPYPVQVATTSTGYFEIDLLQNVDFIVTISHIGFRSKIRVPEASSASLWGLASTYETGDSTPTDTGEDTW
jgi:hypothetical protein